MLKSVALLTEGYVIPFLSITGLTGQRKKSQELKKVIKLRKYLTYDITRTEYF